MPKWVDLEQNSSKDDLITGLYAWVRDFRLKNKLVLAKIWAFASSLYNRIILARKS